MYAGEYPDRIYRDGIKEDIQCEFLCLSIKIPLGSCYNWCPGQDLIYREQEPRRENFFIALRHCFGADGNFNHVAMKSVTKRNRRKSQREAARLKRPGPTLDDEEMEVHFNQTMDTTDSPPASPPHSPTNQGETDYAVVLNMVQNLRDKLSALNLDNENIRAACDALRRQCQDQGVAFGDLSKLVKQSLEGRQSQQPREETGRPHPLIRPDLIDSRGNLRATDIGITWQGSDTFLHSVHHVRCVWIFLRRQPTKPAKRDVRVTDRRHQYSGSTTNPSGGRLGSAISKLLLTYMDGIKTNEHYKWSRTSTRKR